MFLFTYLDSLHHLRKSNKFPKATKSGLTVDFTGSGMDLKLCGIETANLGFQGETEQFYPIFSTSFSSDELAEMIHLSEGKITEDQICIIYEKDAQADIALQQKTLPFLEEILDKILANPQLKDKIAESQRCLREGLSGIPLYNEKTDFNPNTDQKAEFWIRSVSVNGKKTTQFDLLSTEQAADLEASVEDNPMIEAERILFPSSEPASLPSKIQSTEIHMEAFFKFLATYKRKGFDEIYRVPTEDKKRFAFIAIKKNIHDRQCRESELKEEEWIKLENLDTYQMAEINRAAGFLAGSTCQNIGIYYIPQKLGPLHRLNQYFKDNSDWFKSYNTKIFTDPKAVDQLKESLSIYLPPARGAELFSFEWWMEKAVMSTMTVVEFGPAIFLLNTFIFGNHETQIPEKIKRFYQAKEAINPQDDLESLKAKQAEAGEKLATLTQERESIPEDHPDRESKLAELAAQEKQWQSIIDEKPKLSKAERIRSILRGDSGFNGELTFNNIKWHGKLHSGNFSFHGRQYNSNALFDFAVDLGISPNRLPYLISQGNKSAEEGLENQATRIGTSTDPRMKDNVHQLIQKKFNLGNMITWLESASGQDWLKKNQDKIRDDLNNNLRDRGPGLVLGIAALLGAEQIADIIGLDPIHHREERFAFVVTLAHQSNLITSSINEVFRNKALGAPYQFVQSSARGINTKAIQYTYQTRSSTGRAIMASLTRNMGIEASFSASLFNMSKGVIKFPFRTIKGMGPGLASSIIADWILNFGEIDQNDPRRQKIKFAAFFIPDLYRTLVGSSMIAKYPELKIFEGKTGRFIANLAAIGFVADLIMHIRAKQIHGSQIAVYEESLNARAFAAKSQREGIGPEQILAAFSQEAAYGLSLGENDVDLNAIKAADKKMSQDYQKVLLTYLQSQIFAQIKTVDDLLSTEIPQDLFHVEEQAYDQDIENYLLSLSQNSEHENLSIEDKAQLIAEQFSVLENFDTKDLIAFYQRRLGQELKMGLAQIQEMPLEENLWLKSAFDQNAKVKNSHLVLQHLTGSDPKNALAEFQKSKRIYLLSQLLQDAQEHHGKVQDARLIALASDPRIDMIDDSGFFKPSLELEETLALMSEIDPALVQRTRIAWASNEQMDRLAQIVEKAI